MPSPEYITIGKTDSTWISGKWPPEDKPALNIEILEVPSNFKLFSVNNPINYCTEVTFECFYDGMKLSCKKIFANELLSNVITFQGADTIWEMQGAYTIWEMVYEDIIHLMDEKCPNMHELVRQHFRSRLKSTIQSLSKGEFKNAKWPEATVKKDSDMFAMGVDNSQMGSVPQLSRDLPGVDAKVPSPCGCSSFGVLWYLIQHLNDAHDEWTREKIADWIDELHDTGIINAEFEPWEEGE